MTLYSVLFPGREIKHYYGNEDRNIFVIPIISHIILLDHIILQKFLFGVILNLILMYCMAFIIYFFVFWNDMLVLIKNFVVCIGTAIRWRCSCLWVWLVFRLKWELVNINIDVVYLGERFDFGDCYVNFIFRCRGNIDNCYI